MRRIHFVITDSTNLQARRLVEQHPGEPLLVTAGEQSAGRGRLDRTWLSPRGGAWLSFVWPLPTEQNTDGRFPIPLLAAVAVRRALCDVAAALADRLRIKWPNDLLIDDAKLAGILCELLAPTATRPATAIIGVGINVDFDAALLQAPLRRPATTLRSVLGRQVDVAQVVHAVACRIAESLASDGPQNECAAILADLRAHLAHVGLMQTWLVGSRRYEGILAGLDDRGRLQLRTAEGLTTLDTAELLEKDGDNDSLSGGGQAVS